MRVMVHYKLPEKLNSPTGGYLFIFYNKDGELPGGVQPFRFVAPDTCYFGEMAMPKPDATIAQLGNSTQRETLQGLRNQFSRVEAFHIKAVKKGQASRLFFSLEANKGLEKYKDKKRELTVVAIWAPESGWAEKNKYQAAIHFPILSVYDPNRIKVEPGVAYFHKKGPNSLRYRVQFQNIGEGEVKHVSVAIKSSAEQNTGIRSLEGLLLDGDKDGRAGGDVTLVLEAYHCQ